MTTRPLAAVVGVGTELVTGLRVDTNTAEIASALLTAGYRVAETVRCADDLTLISATLRRLTAACSLVVVTGGIGPTHDDITREAAADALGVGLVQDAETVERLRGVARMHGLPASRTQLLRQADFLEGATQLRPVKGTAPGQVIPTPAGRLVLLPGPPHEMRPMLQTLLDDLTPGTAPVRLRCADITESDAQVTASAVLEGTEGIELTVLASPSEIEIVLFDDGAGERALADAAIRVRDALGAVCYSSDGSTLAETVVALARQADVRLAVAESCTGGMVSAAITDVPGASEVFFGGVVSYADDVKHGVLGVAAPTLSAHGAVSAQTAAEMASGIASLLGADIAVSITGIAGPGGGTDTKPVGTVWFGMAVRGAVRTWRRDVTGDRATVRRRSTVYALDAMRKELELG